jgi:hypothetical protein
LSGNDLALLERFELQSVARDLLWREGVKAQFPHPANFHRTAKCLYVPHGADIGVYRSKQHHSSFYSGLVVCAQPGCPVCAAKVSERRRVEIAHAFEQAYQQGLKVVMVTLTHPHRAWDSLSDQLDRQADAFKRLRRGAPWQRIKSGVGMVGLIRSLEVTHGRNGWHPHTHEAWFVDQNADAETLRRKVVKRWCRSLCRAGMIRLPPLGGGRRFAFLRAFYRRAVDVIDNAKSSDYLAKHDANAEGWGADRELAKASSKKGRASGRTPFQLLADARDGDKRSGHLYVEYTQAMKGKPPVFWSQGLKARFGIEDLNDQEIVERQDDIADLLGILQRDEWKLIRQAKARGRLLLAARDDGWEGVVKLLATLDRDTQQQVDPDTGEVIDTVTGEVLVRAKATASDRLGKALMSIRQRNMGMTVLEDALAVAATNLARWECGRESDLCLQGVLYCTKINTVHKNTVQYSTGGY